MEQKEKEAKCETSSIFYRDIVTPILKEINKMESSINYLSTKMEKYSKDNNALFNKVLARRKVKIGQTNYIMKKSKLKLMMRLEKGN